MRRASLLWLGLAAVVLSSVVKDSGADFMRASASPDNAFVAAADFNTVAVSISDPGTPLRGTIALQATASSERGIERVRFESSPAGAGVWTDACEDTSAPYGCNWNTAGVADGSRDLRAVAVDQAGYQRASTIGARLIDNTLPAVSLSDPGVLQGTETLTATGSDGGSGLASLAISYRPSGGSWTTLCTGATSPRSCALNTTTLADGGYELRARSTDVAGNQSEAALTRTVDNTAPTVSVVTPGPLRGVVALSMNASDGSGTGVTGVTLEFRPTGGAWTAVCTDNAAPYQCTGLDTATVPDGTYEARAIATDGAGFSTTSAVVTNIRVDNTPPSTATLNAVGTPLTGSVTLSGTGADAGSGVAAWIGQYSQAGINSWTDACSDTATPFSCAWATTGVMDGRYDLRSLVRDGAGGERVSTVQTNRVIDNDITPTGVDIQTASVGATPGQAEQNDTVTLTYNEIINPSTINASFTGASMAIRVNLTNNAGGDRMDFTTTTGTRLNLVNSTTGLNLRGTNYVSTNTVVFNAMMVQTADKIVITLGTVNSGATRLRTQSAATAAMSWTPSGTARDWGAHAIATTTVNESGNADLEF